jgi:CoA:oxalate CoA-transferase
VLEALRAAAPATVEVAHPTAGELELVAPPFAFESAAMRPAEPPPLLGQHTREVLAELGVAEEHLAALVERGVVTTAET